MKILINIINLIKLRINNELNDELIEIYNIFYDEKDENKNDKILELSEMLSDNESKYNKILEIETDDEKKMDEINEKMKKHMITKIQCEYCDALIYKKHKIRHLNSKRCKEKQNNQNNIIDYKCKFCKKTFNQNDNKNKHELSCNSKDVYYELEQTKKELLSYQNIIDMKNNDINKQDEVITDLRNQLYVLQKTAIEPKHITNNVYINNLNINFNEIQDHLEKYTINVLSNKKSIIDFILGIFINRLVLVDKKKKIIGYYHDNKNQNDIKCKKFLKSCAHQLIEPNNKLCRTHEGLLEKEKMDKAVYNKGIIFNIIEDIDLFVRKQDGKAYIEYIINGIEDRFEITDELKEIC